MTSYNRPGVFIQEISLPQTVELGNSGTASGAFLGVLSKGSTTVPVLVGSWTSFTKTFGNLSDSYPTTWAAYNFFANGGRNLYVHRVVGAGAVSASVTLVDSATPTPANTLTVTAINQGTWGNNLSVQVGTASSSDTFSLTIYDGTSVVEQYTDLSMSAVSSRYVVSVINYTSEYVRVTNLGSVTTVPANMPASGVTLYALTGGATGATPSNSAYTIALALFDPIISPLIFNIPDTVSVSDGDSQTIASSLISYCETRGDAFAIVDVPAGKTATTAKTFVTGITSAFGQSAAYFPWLVVPDSLRATPGATRLQAPGPSMVGQYLATDASRGVFKTPAGYGNRVALAVALESSPSNTDLDNLNTGAVPINAIKQVPGTGIVVMGGRTLNNTPNYRYINVRRSLIHIKKEAERLSGFAVFENNDARLWAQLRVVLSNFLANYWNQGGLKGTTQAQAFYVKCDSTTISPSDILAGRVNIEIGVSLEYPAEFIVIKLGQLTGSASA